MVIYATETYPSNQTLLPSRHRMIHWFPASQKLQKNYTKAIHITFLGQLASHSIPA